MIYFSHILHKNVRDSTDAVVGKLSDIIIKPETGGYAPLLFLVVKRKSDRQEVVISYDYAASMSRGEVVLKNIFSSVETESIDADSGYVYLDRDVMDEQIVDVAGARVVRVNDLKLGVVEDTMSVVGIDVSFRGILRRLGVEWCDVFNVFKVNLIDWRKAQPVKGALKLNTVSSELVRLHPADLANIVENLSLRQGSTLVDSLDSRAAAQVLEEVDPELQKTIINYLGPERAADIVESMSTDETVDLLQMLPKSAARRFLAYLQSAKSKKVEHLINYPTNTAGGLMTTDFLSVSPDMTVAETIADIKRKSDQFRTLLYIYIIDEQRKFMGIVSLRSLLTAPSAKKMKDIMKLPPEGSIIRVHDELSHVARVMTKYDLFTCGVIDEETSQLVGMVTIDDVMRVLVPNA